ncbi:MAG: hypothetical protein EGR99_02810 [Faecalibacterium sp.]|nr:hypothetical protein [Faecalibacterium sp.]
MPAYKNQKTGEWYCIFRVTDWTGKRKQIKKSCFARRVDKCSTLAELCRGISDSL